MTERSSIESYDRDLRHNVWNLSRKLAGLSKDDGFDDISLQSTVREHLAAVLCSGSYRNSRLLILVG